MVDEAVILEAGRRLAAATPHARVILFGSHARGDAGPHSDLLRRSRPLPPHDEDGC